MPNTLAHIAINVPLSKLQFKSFDLKWVLLGTIIPDIPWIIQRFITTIPVQVDPYFLRIYLMIQASFFFSIILALALAAFSSKLLRTFLILLSGSLMHLLSDALEIKWANGVHLYAPFDWTILNFGFFWPESAPVYILTILGIIVYGFYIIKTKGSLRFRSPGKRLLIIILLLLMYFSLPLIFYNKALNSNSHYVRTLSDKSRAGQYFELDRVSYVNDSKGDYLITFADEKLYPENLDLNESGTISIRASFVDNKKININEYHNHPEGVRNMLSLFGLLLIFIYWAWLFIQAYRNKAND